jgi:hypothetical protein
VLTFSPKECKNYYTMARPLSLFWLASCPQFFFLVHALDDDDVGIDSQISQQRFKFGEYGGKLKF